jgi:hypothetical protein
MQADEERLLGKRKSLCSLFYKGSIVSIWLGFVVDKVALGQDFLQVFRFFRQYHSIRAPYSISNMGDE